MVATLHSPDHAQSGAAAPEAPAAGAVEPRAKVLVVDDDFRNIFAMTALLERGRATVLVA